MNLSEDDRQKYLDRLGEINLVPPFMERSYICPECLIQKLNSLFSEIESTEGDPQKQLTILEMVENSPLPTSLHNYNEPLEVRRVEKLKSSASLINEDNLITNLKAMFSKVNNGLQKKESKAERAGTIKSAKIILHTLRNVFPEEIEILLLLGKIYLEEKNFNKASACFKMCINNLKSSEILEHNKTFLLEINREKVLLEANRLYDLVMSLIHGENTTSNLNNDVSSSHDHKNV